MVAMYSSPTKKLAMCSATADILDIHGPPASKLFGLHSEIHNVDSDCDLWLCKTGFSFYSFQPVCNIWRLATDICWSIYCHNAQKWLTGYFLFWRPLSVNPRNSCKEVKTARDQQKFVKHTSVTSVPFFSIPLIVFNFRKSSWPHAVD